MLKGNRNYRHKATKSQYIPIYLLWTIICPVRIVREEIFWNTFLLKSILDHKHFLKHPTCHKDRLCMLLCWCLVYVNIIGFHVIRSMMDPFSTFSIFQLWYHFPLSMNSLFWIQSIPPHWHNGMHIHAFMLCVRLFRLTFFSF